MIVPQKERQGLDFPPRSADFTAGIHFRYIRDKGELWHSSALKEGIDPCMLEIEIISR